MNVRWARVGSPGWAVSGIVLAVFLQLHCSGEESASGPGTADPSPAFPVVRAGDLDLGEIELRLSELDATAYRIEGVERDGDVLRVNIVLVAASQDEETLGRRTLEALREIQPLVGNLVPLSVWSAEWVEPNRKRFRAMAYFSPFTENYHFKLLGRDE